MYTYAHPLQIIQIMQFTQIPQFTPYKAGALYVAYATHTLHTACTLFPTHAASIYGGQTDCAGVRLMARSTSTAESCAGADRAESNGVQRARKEGERYTCTTRSWAT